MVRSHKNELPLIHLYSLPFWEKSQHKLNFASSASSWELHSSTWLVTFQREITIRKDNKHICKLWRRLQSVVTVGKRAIFPIWEQTGSCGVQFTTAFKWVNFSRLEWSEGSYSNTI